MLSEVLFTTVVHRNGGVVTVRNLTLISLTFNLCYGLHVTYMLSSYRFFSDIFILLFALGLPKRFFALFESVFFFDVQRVRCKQAENNGRIEYLGLYSVFQPFSTYLV